MRPISETEEARDKEKRAHHLAAKAEIYRETNIVSICRGRGIIIASCLPPSSCGKMLDGRPYNVGHVTLSPRLCARKSARGAR